MQPPTLNNIHLVFNELPHLSQSLRPPKMPHSSSLSILFGGIFGGNGGVTSGSSLPVTDRAAGGLGGCSPSLINLPGGGGGFGNPLLREPEAVREDALDEYVSIEAARARYGVVLTGSAESCDIEVDAEATRKLRDQLAVERGTST